MKQASRNLALCGVLCALAVAIMAMGTILPVATYCAPVLASMTLLPVLVLCGEKLSWAMFFASAMLSLLLAPDKEAAAIFLALGYYPIVKPKLDRKSKIRRWVGKFLLFNVSILAVYAVGFACALDTLDCSFRNFILFTKFGNLTGKHCTAVSQLRRSILSAHLLDDFRPLCGKGFYPLGQTLAVVHDCLQRWKLVVVYKGVFCKDFLSVFPDAL